MDALKLKYNLAEISEATGITQDELKKRKAALMKTKEITVVRGQYEYDYETVKKLARSPVKPGEPRQGWIIALRQQLKNDGYQVKHSPLNPSMPPPPPKKAEVTP